MCVCQRPVMHRHCAEWSREYSLQRCAHFALAICAFPVVPSQCGGSRGGVFVVMLFTHVFFVHMLHCDNWQQLCGRLVRGCKLAEAGVLAVRSSNYNSGTVLQCSAAAAMGCGASAHCGGVAGSAVSQIVHGDYACIWCHVRCHIHLHVTIV